MVRPRLVKLSGEALKGDGTDVLDQGEVQRVCRELLAGSRAAPVAVVVGGGNIMRGAQHRAGAVDPTRSDYMGMLATLFNSIALREGIERQGGQALVFAPHALPNVALAYERDHVIAALAKGTIIIFGGGTGHPFFTTDTAAALRASEIGADLLCKASTVDGIYSADPKHDPHAVRFDVLSYDQALAGRYGVMDTAAFALCRAQGIAIRVFDMAVPGNIAAALGEHPPGTLVGPSPATKPAR